MVGLLSPDLLLNICLTLVSAGAVYGGIRADIKAMHERINANAALIEAAHRRIDCHLDKP